MYEANSNRSIAKEWDDFVGIGLIGLDIDVAMG